MHKTLAAAIALLAGLVPATAQTPTFKNIFQMTPNAASKPFTPATAESI